MNGGRFDFENQKDYKKTLEYVDSLTSLFIWVPVSIYLNIAEIDMKKP